MSIDVNLKVLTEKNGPVNNLSGTVLLEMGFAGFIL